MKEQEKKAEGGKKRRIAVINFSGNVGKTTISAQMLAARMPDAPFYSIESSNVDASADGFKVKKLRGKDYGDLMQDIFLLEEVVVDVGASNIGDFIKFMHQYHASHEVFDYYIVPVVKEKKQQADTINTIDALAGLGVSPEKIRVIFNKVEVDDPITTVFEPIFAAAAVRQNFTVMPDAVIYANDAFDKVKNRGKSLSDVLADGTDYKLKAREAKNDEEREKFVSMAMVKMLSVSAVKNLDAVYKMVLR